MKTYPYLAYMGKLARVTEEKLFDPPLIAATVILTCFISFIIGLLVL